ncbi:MAG: hypothetical protein WCQ00_00395 [bacterium]
MNNKQINCEEKEDKRENSKIKSIFCYGDADVKKMIWSFKTDKTFYKSQDSLIPLRAVAKELVNENLQNIIICVPSSSFWHNKKSFDHMHLFIRNLRRFFEGICKNKSFTITDKPVCSNFEYIPYSIIPHLNKDLQKGLNKNERSIQTVGAYQLSYYFKFRIKLLLKKITSQTNQTDQNKSPILQILIMDDVMTTGSTIKECRRVVYEYLQKIEADEVVHVNCLTLAYEA